MWCSNSRRALIDEPGIDGCERRELRLLLLRVMFILVPFLKIYRLYFNLRNTCKHILIRNNGTDFFGKF